MKEIYPVPPKAILSALLLFAVTGALSAAEPNAKLETAPSKATVPPLRLAGPASDAKTDEKRVTADLIADVTQIQPGKPFTVGVRFNVPSGYYVYYKSPGSIGLPTKIDLKAPPGFEVGPLQFPGPSVKSQTIGKRQVANYVYKSNTIVLATVTPPAEWKSGDKAELTAKLSYQFCEENGGCYTENATKSLTLSAVSADAKVEPSQDAAAIAMTRKSLPVPGSETEHAKVRAVVNVDKIRPGDKAKLAVVLDVAPGHKIQVNQPTDSKVIPTDVILHDAAGLKKFPIPEYPAGQDPKKPVPGADETKEYRDQVVIQVPFEAKDTLPGESVELSGLVRYQACDENGTCYPPQYASFATSVPVADKETPVATVNSQFFPEASATAQPVAAASATPLDFLNSEVLVTSEADGPETSIPTFMLYAFLGGLILNVMPCVLPVIAIKVLSFVQQAGENRSRIFLLNVFYSLGVITVFLILASLAVLPKQALGWGELFQKPEFNLAMAGVVFAMGLSLLGVFDIPVPGFIGSSGGSGHQEGFGGAFLTGILATLLATPCSGPFLGVTLAWSVKQPAAVTYATWAMMGFGMASPYLLLGLFPQAVKLLPRPGNWMVTFKEFAGFVLMGTVVYIITFLDDTYTVPALVMLVGLALGFWMIGNLYDINSHIKHKALVRVSAVVLTVGICTFGFTTMKTIAEHRKERKLAVEKERWFREIGQTGIAATHRNDSATELPWEPFSEQKLQELLAQGKTVLIDFTADWCLTCKTNEEYALNTEQTRKLVDELGVVTLYADYTEESAEIKRWLGKFNSNSVPLTVIFPGSRPQQIIVLRDLFQESTVLEKLRAAGPSANTVKQAGVSASLR